MAVPTMSPDEERFMAFEGPCATAKPAAAVWILGQQPDAASAIILRATQQLVKDGANFSEKTAGVADHSPVRNLPAGSCITWTFGEAPRQPATKYSQ